MKTRVRVAVAIAALLALAYIVWPAPAGRYHEARPDDPERTRVPAAAEATLLERTKPAPLARQTGPETHQHPASKATNAITVCVRNAAGVPIAGADVWHQSSDTAAHELVTASRNVVVPSDTGAFALPVPTFDQDSTDVSKAVATLTDARGEAEITIPMSATSITIVASSAGRRAFVERSTTGMTRVYLTIPDPYSHRYTLVSGEEVVRTIEQLAFIATTGGGHYLLCDRQGHDTFFGPNPSEWIPYVLPSSGYRSHLPVDTGHGATVRVSCERLITIRALSKETSEPLPHGNAVLFDPDSAVLVSVQEFTEGGECHFAPEHRQKLVLIRHDGFFSQWVDGLDRTEIELVSGQDAELHVTAPTDTAFDVVLTSPDPGMEDRAEAQGRIPLHRGLTTKNRPAARLPVGTYVIVPHSPKYGPATLSVNGTQSIQIALRQSMSLRISGPGVDASRVLVEDRLGNRAVVAADGEQTCIAPGLAPGLIAIELKDPGVPRPGRRWVVELREDNQEFRVPAAAGSVQLHAPDWTTSKGTPITIARPGENLQVRGPDGIYGTVYVLEQQGRVTLPSTFQKVQIQRADSREVQVTFYGNGFRLQCPRVTSHYRVPSGQPGVLVAKSGPTRWAVPADEISPVWSLREGALPNHHSRRIAMCADERSGHVFVVLADGSDRLVSDTFVPGSGMAALRLPEGPARVLVVGRTTRALLPGAVTRGGSIAIP